MASAGIVGEFEVRSVTTVVLDDGFPTTHVTLAPRTIILGAFTTGTLILPGGVVEGEFRRPTPDAFPVEAGETLFLMLEPVPSRTGYYNVAHGFPYGFFRRTQSGGSDFIADSTGRLVTNVDCFGKAERQAEPAAAASRPGSDEPGSERATSTTVRPGLSWDDAILALASCGVP